MDLVGLVNRSVAIAFTITDGFMSDVTFQLQIVWHLDPINDLVNPVPNYTKTVRAVVYKNTLKRRENPGDYVYTESICLQQWADPLPAPGINDRVLIMTPYAPQPLLRQIVETNDVPGNSIWIVHTRLPTADN